AGVLWRVVVRDASEQERWARFFVLGPVPGSAWWSSELRWGSVTDFTREFSQGYGIVAYPVPAQTFTAADRIVLRASVTESLATTRGAEAWRGWSGEALAVADLSAPSRDLLTEVQRLVHQG